MKAIIIAGGTPPSKKLITQELTKNCVIIAADSGANCLWQYKIVPHYLIGDCDSVTPKILSFWLRKSVVVERYPSNKNLTDAQLALKKAIKLNITEVVFLGCLGGKRIDHLLGALGLLDKCAKHHLPASLKDDAQTIILLQKSTIIGGKAGRLFSLQAYGGTVKQLNITGSKYTLRNYALKMGDALTLSNEFGRKKVKIEFKAGKLLLITFTSKTIR